MADDIVQIQSTGTAFQNIDNAQMARPDGVTVDRQRITIKNDRDFGQPADLEFYLLELIQIQRQMLTEMKIQSYLLHQGFSTGLAPGDDLEVLRSDPSFTEVEAR